MEGPAAVGDHPRLDLALGPGPVAPDPPPGRPGKPAPAQLDAERALDVERLAGRAERDLAGIAGREPAPGPDEHDRPVVRAGCDRLLE